MNPYTQFALLSASTLRMLPHILWYLRFKKTIDADLEPYGEGRGSVLTFIKVCTRQKVFRNLFYYRLGEYRSVFIKWLLPEDKSLHITCPRIGEGCHLEHSYSTYLNADGIGRNFYCLHLVTLGNGRDGRPTIGDNVYIGPSVCIVEDVKIGDNATIGAGAVVTRDIPAGTTAAGVPAKVISNHSHPEYIQNKWQYQPSYDIANQ